MPVSVSYPGVYIQEVPSGSRAIAGVPTSVAAFIGYTARGPVDTPVRIFNYGDFERQFGGLDLDSALSYSVSHFFENGGGQAWIVRVASGAAAASVALQAGDGGAAAGVTLTATAVSEGAWGNALMLVVDYDSSDPLNTFNLSVTELGEQNGRLVALRTETHRNLSMFEAAPTYAVASVNAASDLIELQDAGLTTSVQGSSESSVVVDDALVSGLTEAQSRIAISVDGRPSVEIRLFEGAVSNFANVEAYRAALEAAINALDGVAVTVTAPGGVITIESDRSGPAGSDATGRSSAVVVRNAASNNAAAVLGLGQANGGREVSAAAAPRPMQSGKTGTRIADFAADVSISAGDTMDISLVDLDNLGAQAGAVLATETITFADAPTSFGEARAAIQAALTASPNAAFAGAVVRVVDNTFTIVPAQTAPGFGFVCSDTAAGELNLAGGTSNVARYQPGVGQDKGAQVPGLAGADGGVPAPADIIGNFGDKTGIYALEDVDLFNILCLPGTHDIAVVSPAVTYAEGRRAMMIADIDPNVDTLAAAEDWITNIAGPIKNTNSVAYWPRVELPDPLQQNRLRAFPNSGLMAGLWARTDGARGIWKAPAGIEAALRGVQGLEYTLSDPENGVLNPLGLNALRNFPVYGPVAWGGRTLRGADAQASEWKYIPVRRTALFIEESLYRGTQFAVFEPNDEPLWAEIRLAVGSFMNTLFRQGAFQGASPREAYFVRCDASTTTQADIDLGIVNIQVGFAPLKPAEFVIISLQQIAGQGQ